MAKFKFKEFAPIVFFPLKFSPNLWSFFCFRCFYKLCPVLHSKCGCFKDICSEKTSWQSIILQKKKRIGHVVGNFMICSGTLGCLPWCFFERTFRQYLVQRIEVQKKKVRKSRFLRNETFRKPFDFFKTAILGMRCCWIVFWREFKRKSR